MALGCGVVGQTKRRTGWESAFRVLLNRGLEGFAELFDAV